ncbi:MAG: FG-GAP-like repeat-containing protein [Pirellulales bacterium]
MLRTLGHIKRSILSAKVRRSRRNRRGLLEQLEPRRLMAAAIWHNVVHELDVSGDSPAFVSPRDALLVINWLNDTTSPRVLPRQIDQARPLPLIDVNCDGRVSPSDALEVINHLNEQGAGLVGGVSTSGGTFEKVGCSPQLLEGQGFSTELERILKVPSGRPVLELMFQAPHFDTASRGQIRDAMEVTITDMQGVPLLAPLSSTRQASFNWTEGFEPMLADGVSASIAPMDQDSKLRFDLSSLKADTEFRVLTRLINNDSDDSTNVIIRGYEFVEMSSSFPSTGQSQAAARRTQAVQPFDIRQLTDLSGYLNIDHGQTSLSADEQQLTTRISVTNTSSLAIAGPLIAVFEDFTQLNVHALHPDGILPDGRPYLDLTQWLTDKSLSPREHFEGSEIQFLNKAGLRFDFQMSLYGRVNTGPSGFVTQPLTSIEGGKLYVYTASAQATVDPRLSYSLSTGPTGMTVDAESGKVSWQTTQADAGSHQIVIRATDSFGMHVDQSFDLVVEELLANRPPNFVTTPSTEAIASGGFEVLNFSVGGNPASAVIGDLGYGKPSIVTLNQRDQTLTVLPSIAQADRTSEKTLSIGVPPQSDRSLIVGQEIDLSFPPYAFESRNFLDGFAQADMNGDGFMDTIASVRFTYLNSGGNFQNERYLTVSLGNGDGTFREAVRNPVPGPVPGHGNNGGLVSLQAMDFNRDGAIDILAVDTSNQLLVMYTGRGDGSLLAPQAQANSTPLSGFLVADFNKDGKLDLLAQHQSPDTLGVMQGVGDGTFGPFQQFANTPGTGYYDRAYAVGDLNKDGFADVVLGGWESRSLSIFLNDGSGSLQLAGVLPAKTSETATESVSSVSIADYDSDGKVDILYGTTFGASSGGGLSLYHGDGSGINFVFRSAAQNFLNRPSNLIGNNQPVDINKDGLPDVLLTLPGAGYSFIGGILVGLNRGDGTFETSTIEDVVAGTHDSTTNQGIPLGALVADYNLDGLLDVVSITTNPTNGTGYSGASLLLADRPASFQTATEVENSGAITRQPAFVQTGDFNNDGLVDLWLAGGPSITRLSNGDGTFGPEIIATPPIGNEFLAKGFTADFDNDGNLDVFWLGTGGVQGGPTGRYLTALGNGDGTFGLTFMQPVPDTFYGSSFAMPGDFNGDGYADFAAIGGGIFGAGPYVEVWLYNSEQRGTFTQSQRMFLPRSPSRGSLAVADFNNDEKLDLVVVMPRAENSGPQLLQFFAGSGNGLFEQPTTVEVSKDSTLFQAHWLASGDLNEDGNVDLVLKGSYGKLSLMMGQGDGTFGYPIDFVADGYFDSNPSIEVVDFNNDGHLDILSSGDGGGPNNRISLRLGRGDGTFSDRQVYDVSGTDGTTGVADFDSDGALDVAFLGSNPLGNVAILNGKRRGLVDAAIVPSNNGQRLDLLALNHTNSHLTIFNKDSSGNLVRKSDLFVGAGPVALAEADLNGDNVREIVTANRSAHSISVLTTTQQGWARSDFDASPGLVDIELKDVTRDSVPDAILLDDFLNVLVVMAGDGQGGFNAPEYFALGDRPIAMAVGNITQTNRVDAAILLATQPRVLLMSQNSQGGFEPTVTVDLPAVGSSIAVGDFNLDGLGDLAVTLSESNQVLVLFGMGGGRFTRPQAIEVGQQPKGIRVADVNGDSRPDILVSNFGDDTISVIVNRYDLTQVYRYDARAIDPDNDIVHYELTDSPGGMIIDSGSGAIRWAPSGYQLGTHRVTVRASDERGGWTEQSYSIEVVAPKANETPVIVTPDSIIISADQPLDQSLKAIDSDGDTLRYRLLEGPEGASVDPITGQLQWDPRNPTVDFGVTRNDYSVINVPNQPALDITSLTAEGWFRFDRNDMNVILFRKAVWNPYPFAEESYTLRWQWGALRGQIGRTYFDSDSASYPWTPELGQWYHIAMTFDDASKKIRVFLNGNEVASTTTDQQIRVDDNPLQIGYSGDEYNGAVSQFRLWNSAHDQATIRSRMFQTVPSNSEGLVLDYRFQEGSALTVMDSSVNAIHGTFGGNRAPSRAKGLGDEQTAQFRVSVEDGRGGADTQTLTVKISPTIRGAIGGQLFDDTNGDGLKQGSESGLANWTVFVDQNANGTRDENEAKTITDGQGNFQINGLQAGSYPLTVEPRVGFKSVAPRKIEVKANETTSVALPTEATSGGRLRGTVSEASRGSVLAHQRVFADLNQNGLWDADEPESYTDQQGRYELYGLNAGSYQLRLSSPPGWSVTSPTSLVHDVVLANQELLDGLDFQQTALNAWSNAQPIISSIPAATARVGNQYRYSVSAVSPVDRQLKFDLSVAPSGMVVDPINGVVVWTPSQSQIGANEVILRVTDEQGIVCLQSFSIAVAIPNANPVLTSSPSSLALVASLWHYQIQAQDAEDSQLTFSLINPPSGVTIDQQTGLVLWTPTPAQASQSVGIVVQVSDPQGGQSRQAFNVQVLAQQIDSLPYVIQPPSGQASLLLGYAARTSGVDRFGNPLRVELVSGPAGLTLEHNGLLQWQPSSQQLGSHDVVLRYRDTVGGHLDKTSSIVVKSTANRELPEILSQQSKFAVAGSPYSYDIAVKDTGDAVTYALIQGPAGMSLGAGTGSLRWIPGRAQQGFWKVVVQVSNSLGGSVTHAFDVTARLSGGPPSIESVPPTVGSVGNTLLYSVVATDPENDPLIYRVAEGPAGMSIDSRTGELSWTPDTPAVGQHPVVVAVADGFGNESVQSFSIVVGLSASNRAPLVVSQPTVFGVVGKEYTYSLSAQDPEAGALAYQLRRGPTGMTIDSSGLVRWTPTANQAGRHAVTLVAMDAQEAAGIQTFELDILAQNVAPVISSLPKTIVYAGAVYQYDIVASDANLDPLVYEFASATPAGMNLDSLGRVRWQTTTSDLGEHSIAIRVRDPRGGEAIQTVNFTVAADQLAPRLSVVATPGKWPWESPIVIQVSAIDNVAVADLKVLVNDRPVALDAYLSARLRFDDWGVGDLRIEVSASDAAGNRSTASTTSFYRDPEVDYESGEGLPVANILSPTADGTVFGMVEITGSALRGTAVGTAFKEYRLSYARLDKLSFTEIVRSQTEVSDGLLGVWDTSLLENDSYVLRLEVVSVSGNTTVDEIQVGISGNLKLGNFRLSFDDLKIPVGGIPITVVRTYDTLRSDRDGDFGFGWRMEYRSTDLRTSLPKSGAENIGIYTPYRLGTKVYMSLPGGQRVGWTFTPEIRALAGFGAGSGLVLASPKFTPDRGNTNQLSVGGGWLLVNEYGELYSSGGVPWNPASPDFGGYSITTAEGLEYRIDGTSGQLNSVTDRNGNMLSFSELGIFSSTGSRVAIARDLQGRITQIKDTAGKSLVYAYDSVGNLTSLTDRAGNRTTLSYSSSIPHYLESVTDPLGRKGVRAEYAADGRLRKTIDASGNSVAINYDPNNQLMTTYDRLGNPTTFEYDTQGNVIAQTDALGGVKQTTYDSNNYVISETDPLGRTTRFTRDQFGNALTTTNPMGSTTQLTYDNFGNLIKEADPLGRTTQSAYDAHGNLLRTVDASGTTTSYSNDSSGRLQTMQQPSGFGFSFGYTNSSEPTASSDWKGLNVALSYDASNRPISRTYGVQMASGLVNATEAFQYDDNNRVIAVTDVAGATQRREFDAAGQVAASIDAAGNRTTYVYDVNGKLIRTQRPDGCNS